MARKSSIEKDGEMTRFNATVNRAKHIKLRSILAARHETQAQWIEAQMEREIKKSEGSNA